MLIAKLSVSNSSPLVLLLLRQHHNRNQSIAIRTIMARYYYPFIHSLNYSITPHSSA